MEKIPFGEVEAKAVICRHLFKKLGNGMSNLISELPVFRKSTRADLVVEADGLLHAFEVKSAKDSLVRLARQVEGLIESFDTVTVVVDEKHLKAVRGIVKPNVGIWVLAYDEVLELRRAAKQKVSKQSKLGMISKAGLISLIGGDASSQGLSRLQLESFASKLSKSAIDTQLRTELQKRYKVTHNRFLATLATSTNSDGIVQALSPNLNKKAHKNSITHFDEISLESWRKLFPTVSLVIQSTQSSSSTTNASDLRE